MDAFANSPITPSATGSSEEIWDALRAPPPASIVVRGTTVRAGQRVRLAPRAGGDVMDLALAGRTAVIEGIDLTTDGEPHFTVTLDDDPGRDLGARRYPWHRFFFRADEIEPLADTARGAAASCADSAGRPTRVLVAGVGNIFFGDDAFGVAVARRLVDRAAPPGVTVADFGIRGLDLAYALQDDYDAAILVDATARGGAPGTVYVIEPDLEDVTTAASVGVAFNAHGMDPVRVLRLARALGRVPARVVVVGCEPVRIGGSDQLDDGLVDLSPPVAAAVDVAVDLVTSLLQDLAAVPIHPPH
jgi:hydrogenase maturation protease